VQVNLERTSFERAAHGAQPLACTGQGWFFRVWSWFPGEDARVLAAAGFDAWERLLADALERMRQRGELRADTPTAGVATGLLASIEGGMVLSQARKDMGISRRLLEKYKN
jgi:hypothetical protein